MSSRTKSPTFSRPDRKELYFAVAALYALRATCPRRHVGAVAVRRGRIIATGYNGAPPGQPHCLDSGARTCNSDGCSNSTHAETNLIAHASRHGPSLDAAALYTGIEPCSDCARIIVAAGFAEVYFVESYEGSRGGGVEILTKAKLKVGKYVPWLSPLIDALPDAKDMGEV